jgi:hypothetical protein
MLIFCNVLEGGDNSTPFSRPSSGMGREKVGKITRLWKGAPASVELEAADTDELLDRRRTGCTACSAALSSPSPS